MSVINQIFEIAGSLGIFFFGMKIMSEAIQRMTGDKLRTLLSIMTRNRFGGLLTGLLITSIIQSSSATTVMVVSFVNAGLLTLVESIGVIMGANLGTTITVWIVSLLGFKVKITIIALPAIAIGVPFLFSKGSQKKDIGEFLIGFGLLFMGLSMLKHAVPDIKSNPEILEFVSNYSNLGFLSVPIFIFIGVILTIVVQSSSAAAAITVTMAFQGWIDFQSGAAIILGENIGTTITAYLAALGANVHARRAARAHLIFNVIGVLWMMAIFYWFTSFIDWIVPGDVAEAKHIPVHLSAFHTLFNFVNICILIPFVPKLANLVEKLVKPREREMGKEYRLEYITTSSLETAQISLMEANNEIIKMAEITEKMYLSALEVFFNPDKKMGPIIEKLKEYEELTDIMEEEISRYLVQCSKETLNQENAIRVTSMLRIIDELESIADSCYSLTLTIQRKYEKKMNFHRNANDEIKIFADQVIEFIRLNIQQIKSEVFSEKNLKDAYQLENQIDESRAIMRKNSVERIQEHGYVKSELLFMDILKNFERIGDYSLNISQALRKSTSS